MYKAPSGYRGSGVKSYELDGSEECKFENGGAPL